MAHLSLASVGQITPALTLSTLERSGVYTSGLLHANLCLNPKETRATTSLFHLSNSAQLLDDDDDDDWLVDSIEAATLTIAACNTIQTQPSLSGTKLNARLSFTGALRLRPSHNKLLLTIFTFEWISLCASYCSNQTTQVSLSLLHALDCNITHFRRLLACGRRTIK